jgi:hypothetical protein
MISIIVRKFMIYTLERKTGFLFEKRTEMYRGSIEGASQKKILYGAKSAWQAWALLKLDRHGV